MIKFSITDDDELLFEEEKYNKFIKFFEECDDQYPDLVDCISVNIDEGGDGSSVVEEFVQDYLSKKYFLYDGGSNESDYPPVMESFDSLEAMDYFLNHEHDSYNIHNVQVFNFDDCESYKVKCSHTLVK